MKLFLNESFDINIKPKERQVFFLKELNLNCYFATKFQQLICSGTKDLQGQKTERRTAYRPEASNCAPLLSNFNLKQGQKNM